MVHLVPRALVVTVVEYPERWHRSFTSIYYTTDETRAHETWTNTSVSLVRTDERDEPVTYRRARNYSVTPGHPTALDRAVRRDLAFPEARPGADVSVEARVHDGTTVYVVPRTASRTVRGTNTTETHRFRVRDDGFVIGYTTRTIRVAPDGGTVVTVCHYALDIHRNDTLGPREWVDEARPTEIGEETDDE